MILADYRCGCTWIGRRNECLEYCAKHGENRRLIHRLRKPKKGDSPLDLEWDWQTKMDEAQG